VSSHAPNPPSLSDVARLAGVSLATASRAINNAYGVSAATRRKVLAVVEQLDFVASPEAERLARGVTGRIALVVPHIERWYFGEMVAGIERELSTAGFDVLLYHVDGPDDRRDFFGRLPARRKVDACIVVAFPLDEDERKRLEVMGVAMAAAGGQIADHPFASIDDYAAGRLAVDHLLALGHRRIAMIASCEPNVPGWPVNNLRTRAYIDAMQEQGVPTDPNLVREIEWSAHNADRAMHDLLTTGSQLTAVYVHSDELALGAMHALRAAGLRVPEDVSVVGIDDHPIAEFLDLTTVHQPVREQGVIAARIVLQSIHGENREFAPQSVLLPTRLVVRGSTAKPRSG